MNLKRSLLRHLSKSHVDNLAAPRACVLSRRASSLRPASTRQLWQERNDFRDRDHQGDQRQKCHAEWQDAYENPKERHVTCKISDDEYIDPKRWRDQGQFDDNHHENTESNRIEAHVRDDREEDVHREDDHGHGIEESTQKDVVTTT